MRLIRPFIDASFIDLRTFFTLVYKSKLRGWISKLGRLDMRRNRFSYLRLSCRFGTG